MSKALELAKHFERSAAAIKKLDEIVETTTRKANRYLETAAELRRLASVESELAALKESLRGLEPVAYLWQHGETGRTRIVSLDTVFTAQSSWFVAGPVFTLPPNLKG